MAGLIRAEDVQEVKERTPLDEVVREHVTLRPAGAGSLKGLCPFHDEKTPSFTVRPAVGHWHCFGCNEGGDVITFVQKVDHLSFAEAVERLAGRAGMELRYDDSTGRGGRRDSEGGLGRRARLVEAHRAAAEFYHRAITDPLHPAYAEARVARDFLRAKGFNGEDARRFQVGYAPRAGDALSSHLRTLGFTTDELVTGGLARRGGRYDVFQGRVLWPIRDITGDTVGFGARRLFDDDRMPGKYVNTAETPIYKKATVLYGLDLAKKEMAEQRRAVVVEGYTDVMAAHLSGVGTAVATCGTAFGAEHIRTLRRILRDEPGLSPARVIFTFDGDAAGQKAAMRAFADDQQWASQSYVAVAPAGQDPNDLRLSEGSDAVRELVEHAVPMFEFAVRTRIASYDLDRPQERVQAMRAVAPILAGIRDRSLRPEYTREVAGWLGVPVEELAGEVRRAGAAAKGAPAGRRAGQAGREPGPGGQGRADGPGAGEQGPPTDGPVPVPPPDLRDPGVQAERQLLQVLLQFPGSVDAPAVDGLTPGALRAPAHQAVLHGIRGAGGLGGSATMSAAAWTGAVVEHTPQQVRHLVHELAVAPLPVTFDPGSGVPPQRYVDSLLNRVLDDQLGRRIAEAMSALQRSEPGGTDSRRLNEELTGLHRERARLRAGME